MATLKPNFNVNNFDIHFDPAMPGDKIVATYNGQVVGVINNIGMPNRNGDAFYFDDKKHEPLPSRFDYLLEGSN